MPVNVIDTLKPKNGLSFPIVEAIDVFVDGFDNLADAISHFATDAMIEAINTVLSGKANTSAVNTAVSGLQAQIDQIAQTAGTGTADTEIGQARVGSDGTSYQTLKQRIDGDIAIVENDISDIEIILPNPKYVAKGELFDESIDTVNDKMVSPGGGALTTQAGYTATEDYIEIDSNMQFYLTFKTACYGAYYDKNKTYISGITYESTPGTYELTSPANAKYIRLSTPTANISDLSVEVKASIPGYHIKSNQVDGLENAIIATTEPLRENVSSLNNVLPNAEYVLKGELFDSSVETIDGKFVNPNNGNLSSNESWTATDFIKINPNMPMLISCKEVCYGAYYNENKVRVAGITYESTGAREATSPETAHYIRLSTYTTRLSNLSVLVKGKISSFHIDSVQVDGLNEAISDITAPITTEIESINEVLPYPEYVLKGELFDASVETYAGKFVLPGNGSLGDNPDYTATDYIEIAPNMAFDLTFRTACYGAFYNESKTRVAGITYETRPGTYRLTSPETAHYIRVSTPTSVLSSLSIKVSEQLKGYHIDVSQIDNMNDNFVNTTTYTVGATGCDFTKLRDAFAACTDGTANNRYIVKFKGDGSEYNLANEITAEELADSSFMGVYVPKYTQLVGIGGKNKCIIVLRLDNESTKISTLNLYGSSGLEGLTIIGYNTRYTVHDDFSDPDAVRYVKNCKIIAEKAVYESAWGAGSRSGNTWYFENCEFISNQYNAQPFFSHNNMNFTAPTRFYFDNCRFRNTISGGMDHITFRSLNNNANGIINEVYIHGCEASKVHLGEESQSLYGSGILFACSGYGNTFSNADCTYTSSDGVDYSDRFDFI